MPEKQQENGTMDSLASVPYNLFFIRPIPRCVVFAQDIMTHPVLSGLSFVGRFNPIITPVLSIENHSKSPLFPQNGTAFLVTSIFGADALYRWGGDPTMPVIAVGRETGNQLRHLGFKKIIVGSGHDGDLVIIAAKNVPPGTPICHVSGVHVARDLTSDFQRAGFDYRRFIGYGANAASSLSVAATREIRGQNPGGVFLFSNRSRQIFESLISGEFSCPPSGFLDAYCYSPTIAAACTSPLWRSVAALSSPPFRASESMIELLLHNQRTKWGIPP